jgi:hypothetical protein
MSALIWVDPTGTHTETGKAVDPLTNAAALAMALPSEKTTYVIQDIGGSAYAFCRVQNGSLYTSWQMALGVPEETAKQSCQQDWDSGQRP